MTTYNPAWSNANSTGLVDSTCFHSRSALDEIAAAINRRRLLVLQNPFDYASLLNPRPFISQYVIDDSLELSPADNAPNFRQAIIQRILGASPGQDIAYMPTNPTSMVWLWPLADADENKTIVTWLGSPSATQVGLYNRLNGGSTWTDYNLDVGALVTQDARAVHVNELRLALEWLRRCRWTMPVYGWYGLVNSMSGTPWMSGIFGADGANDVRAVFGPRLHIEHPNGLPLGLHNVRPLSASLSLTSSQSCVVEVRQILRPITIGVNGMASWDFHNNATQSPWAQGGATGPGDSEVVCGPISMTANVPLVLDIHNTAGWLTMWQSMLDQNSPPYFLIRRLDTGPTLMNLSNASVTLDFELNSPPA
jgi:hypothetical protein